MADYGTELALAEAVLSGDPAAADEFVDRHYANILSFLESKCAPCDRHMAQDVVQSLMAECSPGGKLARYSGIGSLEGWLKTTAYNELKHEFKKQNRILPLGDDLDHLPNSLSESNNSKSEGPPTATDFHRILMEAAVEAFHRLRTQHPDSLAILRLKALHQVSQKRIAAAFGIRESEVSRKKGIGMNFLRSEVESILKSRFPEGSISMEDIHSFAHHADEICHDEERASEILARMGLS